MSLSDNVKMSAVNQSTSEGSLTFHSIESAIECYELEKWKDINIELPENFEYVLIVVDSELHSFFDQVNYAQYLNGDWLLFSNCENDWLSGTGIKVLKWQKLPKKPK